MRLVIFYKLQIKIRKEKGLKITMILSNRLLTIAKQVNHHDVICDIGTDHGLLPIYLAKANQIIQAYAVDINPLPLAQLKKNLVKYQVNDLIIPVLADGLS